MDEVFSKKAIVLLAEIRKCARIIYELFVRTNCMFVI